YHRFIQQTAKDAFEHVSQITTKHDYSIPIQSQLMTRIQEIMNIYVPIDEYLMTENVTSAMQQPFEPEEEEDDELSDEEDDDDKIYSPLVDDTFFIIKQSLERSVSTYNISIVGATINHIKDILL